VRVVTLGGTNSEKDLKQEQEHHINILKGGFKEIDVYDPLLAVLRIRIHKIHMFLGLPHLDPLIIRIRIRILT
jgi:hypothetical protein